jgi:hypothetical protein
MNFTEKNRMQCTSAHSRIIVDHPESCHKTNAAFCCFHFSVWDHDTSTGDLITRLKTCSMITQTARLYNIPEVALQNGARDLTFMREIWQFTNTLVFS